MAALRDRMKGLASFSRGVHPPHRKSYSEAEPIRLLVPEQDLAIPLAQHIGSACTPTVKPKTEVAYGEKLADAEAFVSAPIHASVSGTTGQPTMMALPSGRRVPGIPLRLSKERAPLPEGFLEDFLRRDWDSVEPTRYDPDQIVMSVREAGVVGLGGATFPTHVKLRRNPHRPIDTVILNGCECEPYLTADHRLMVECPEAIAVGLALAAHALGAPRAVVAIEENKPDAIDAMRKAIRGRVGLEVKVCATKYPMGGERQLIPAVLNRAVPSAPKGLPLDVSVVVVNVATAHGIARAVVHGKPLTHRVVSVTGGGVTRPGNWLIPVGTSFAEVIERCCAGMTPAALKVLAGGPMMGPTISDLRIPIVKGTGGITVMTEAETSRRAESPCIRCGRCIDNCPLYLSPAKIAQAVKFRDFEMAKRYDHMACCECGCCSYVCPAHIPVAQYIRAGKNQWWIIQAQKKQEDKKAG